MSNRIVCPNCGTEYLPCEVFYPKHLLGYCTEIEKDIYGKIIYNNGIDPNMTENFTCDKCNKNFIVKANLSFDTKLDNLRNFEDEVAVPLYTDRITLKED